MGRKNIQQGRERQIRKMLMIDRVEVIALDQFLQTGEFERDDAIRLEQFRKALDEIVDIGNMGEDIVADHQVNRAPLAQEPPSHCTAEEIGIDGQPALACPRRRARCRLDAVAGDFLRLEMLQQITVVGGDLHDKALRPKLETIHGRLDIKPRVLNPRGRA
jgi:hypothetical protein